MPCHVAYLRGVSPMNAKMAELIRSFEGEGFSDVKTMLSSGNVVFNARAQSENWLGYIRNRFNSVYGATLGLLRAARPLRS